MAGTEQELNQAANQVRQETAHVIQDVTDFPAFVQVKIKTGLEMAKTGLTNFSGGVNGAGVDFLANGHIWSGVCLVAFFLGEVIGKNALYAMTTQVFGTWSAVMVFGIFVPLTVWGVGKYVYGPTGSTVVLVGSGLLGGLMGSALHGYQLRFVAPPPAVLPLSMAAAAYIVGSSPALMSDRRLFDAVMITPAVIAYLLLGLQQMCTTYVLYSILLITIAVIDLQVKLDSFFRGDPINVQAEQWTTVVVLGVADLLAFWLMAETR